MSNLNINTPAILFLTIVSNSIALSACGDDGPSSSDQDPDFDFSAELIAFSTYRHGNWEIYSIKLDGTDPVHLTSHTTDDDYPVWRP